MLRLLIAFAAIAALSVASAWLAGNPGDVALHWREWRVDTSAAFLLLLCALSAVAFYLLILIIRLMVRGPKLLRQHKRQRNYALGLRAVTESLVALASSDVTGARKLTQRAQKYLGNAPITLLLSAQLAKLEGKDAETRTLLESMLEHSETRFLAARGLSEYHDRKQEAAQATPYAEQAFALHPKDPKALSTLISAYARQGRWQEAQAALAKARFTISRTERLRMEGMVCLLKAQMLSDSGEEESALAFARRAHKLLPEHAPAAALYVRLTDDVHGPETALGALKKAWKRAPHRQLADVWMALADILPQGMALKAAQKASAHAPNDYESQLLLARAAVQAQSWDIARRALKTALAIQETAEACTLMAELETKAYRDHEASARWKLKASQALPQAEWVCGACAHTAAQWHAHCPRCNAFDRMEWKTRGLTYVAA